MKNLKSTITTILLILTIIAVLGACVSLLKLSPVAKKTNNSGSDPYIPVSVPADKIMYKIHVIDTNNYAINLSSENVSIYLENSSSDLSGAGYFDGNIWSILLPGTGSYNFTITIPGYSTFNGNCVFNNDALGTIQYYTAIVDPVPNDSGNEEETSNVCTYRISAIDSATNNPVSLEMCEPNIYFTSDPDMSTDIQGIIQFGTWMLSIPTAGEYTFTISLSGYETYTGTLTVTSADIGLERMTTITLVPANV